MKDKVIVTYCCVCICVCACVCVCRSWGWQTTPTTRSRSCWTVQPWSQFTLQREELLRLVQAHTCFSVSLFEHEQINHRWCHVRAEIVVFWSPGEALRCHMGEVWRILQQEEHDHVWRHWTELPHEPTEWTKGREPTLFFYYILCLTFSCSSCSYALVLQNTEYVLSFRSDPSWRLTWTERRTESSINWLSTLKK